MPYDNVTTKLVNVVGNNFDSALSIYSQLFAQPALPHQSSSAKKSKEMVTIDWTKRYNACSDSDEDINFGDDDEVVGVALGVPLDLNEGLYVGLLLDCFNFVSFTPYLAYNRGHYKQY